MNKEEYKEWYSSCEFIQKEMQFYSFKDFLCDAHGYKIAYKRSSQLTKKLYKWYIYANTHISYDRKNVIWDYLNGYISLKELKDR